MHDAGDIVHFLAIKMAFGLYVKSKQRREIQIDQKMIIKLAKTRIKNMTTRASESF